MISWDCFGDLRREREVISVVLRSKVYNPLKWLDSTLLWLIGSWVVISGSCIFFFGAYHINEHSLSVF